MAVLAAQDRIDGCADYQRGTQPGDVFGALLKADLQAAFNALDQWLSDNAAAVNSTIPQPARGALTTVQKSRLFRDVIKKRYEKGA
jgi:hypothetical protein